MWIIWKEELYKIASRRIIWLSVILLLMFLTFRLFAERDNYRATIDGETFYGQEAIDKDKALAKKHAGILTEEKIDQIYKRYGFYYYDPVTNLGVGNFCSRYITEKFTNFMQTEGTDPDEILFYTGEEWERNAAPLLEKKVSFDYIYGWSDFAEMNMLAFQVLYIILIIGISPVFAEEYTMKTADILRTTKRGKKSGIWLKALAAICFAELLSLGVTLYLWVVYLSIYGTQGLDASAVLLNFASFYGYCPKTAGGLLLFITFLGFLGILLLVGITFGISARCKTPFLALIISLVLFLLPVFWVKVLGPMWLFGISVTKSITHFMTSMPVYLPMSTGFAFSGRQMAIHAGIALTVGAGSVIYGYFRYRSCKV